MPLTAKRKNRLISVLTKLYPAAASELVFKNRFQLIVSVILSAQCTDKKVNQVTPELFRRFPSFAALAQADLRAVEEIIRPVNYYRTKAKHIIAMAQGVLQRFNGRLPAAHAELRSLPGVGQKTANVIQCEIGAQPALPVDTHVFRVSKRLGLASGKNPEEGEEELKAAFDSAHWRGLHHRLILHGRRVCKAPRPLCDRCRLSRRCPSFSAMRAAD